MSRQAYTETLTYPEAVTNLIKAASSAEVFVYKAGTETLATIYEQRSGGSPKVNPFVVGSNAFCNFWADTGDYDIKVHDTIVPARFGDLKYGWQSSPVDTQVEAADLSNSGDIEWTQEGGGAWVPQLKAGSVGTNELAASAVTNAKIGTDAVDASKILANAVLASEIGTLPQCRVRKTTDTAIAGSTPTYLTFPTEAEDTDGMHSTSSNTGRIVVATPGLYMFYASLSWVEQLSGYSAWFRKTIAAGGTEIFGYVSGAPRNSGLSNVGVALGKPMRMVANDYVEVGINTFEAKSLVGESATVGFGQEFGCIWMSD